MKKEESKDASKYNIKMKPLAETIHTKEKITLFKPEFEISSKIEELNRFCTLNKKIINQLIKSKPNLFVEELEELIKYMPNLLDFENKRQYFRKELAKMKRNHHHNDINLMIRRDNIFMDAHAQLNGLEADQMRGRIVVRYNNEAGIDAGGLVRDFFIELSREMFNPNYSLFNLSSSGSTYYPNPKSYVEKDHLRYFKFIGRIIGKAIFDEQLLECYFVKSLYKIVLGEPLSFADVEDFDNEFFNNLKWCLENNVECLMTHFVLE